MGFGYVVHSTLALKTLTKQPLNNVHDTIIQCHHMGLVNDMLLTKKKISNKYYYFVVLCMIESAQRRGGTTIILPD